MEFIPLAEPRITEADIAAVTAQLASTFVGPGAEAVAFGERIAEIANRQYALPTCSGTVALSVAALAIGLQPGDEIILPGYGVLSVVNAFASIGLKPVLADIDPVHGCMSPSALEQALTEKTKAVCYISFLGSLGESLSGVKSLCEKHQLILIEDAAWSLGRRLGDRVGGASGDIAITSFSVPKIVTTGQGGAVLTNSLEAYQASIRLTDQGGLEWRKTNNIEIIGSNCRMSDINAALGVSQLATLDERHQYRQKTFEVVNEILDNKLVNAEDGLYPAQHVIFVSDKQAAIKKIKSANIGASSPYGVYSHLTPYHDLDGEGLAGSHFWEQHAVILPFGIGTDRQTMISMAERVKALNLDLIEV